MAKYFAVLVLTNRTCSKLWSDGLWRRCLRLQGNNGGSMILRNVGIRTMSLHSEYHDMKVLRAGVLMGNRL